MLDHFLLLVCAQRTGRLSPRTHALDGVGDILRLVDERIAEIGRPIEIIVHLLDDFGKARERLHGRIPRLPVEAGVILLGDSSLVLVKPALCLHNIDGVGGCRKRLRQQRVRIERDGRDELFDFLGGIDRVRQLSGSLSLRGGGSLLDLR